MANEINYRSDELADLLGYIRPRLAEAKDLAKLKKELPSYFKTYDLMESCNNHAQRFAERAAKQKFIESGKPGDLEKIRRTARETIQDRKRSIAARCWLLYNQAIVPLLRSILDDASEIAREQATKLTAIEKTSAESYGIVFTPSRTLTAVSESSRRLKIWAGDMIVRDRSGTPPDPRRVLKFFLLDSDLA